MFFAILKSITKNMKKVLFLITKSNFGGAQRYVFDLATSLPKNEFDVTVAYGEGRELGERLHSKGIRTIEIKGLARDINILKEFSVFWAILKLYKKEKPDIVHINSSKVGGLGAFAGKIAGIPKIIFTGHGWAFNEDRNVFSKFIIFLIHAMTILMTNKTIAVSSETKRQITLKCKSLGNKIEVIHNGVEEVEPIEKASARQFIINTLIDKDINPDSLWIGTVGELHPIKGHSYLLDALAELKEDDKLSNIQTFIIGEGKERKNLERKISGFGLSKNVFLTGNIKNASHLMKAFDLFVFPSLSEAFPYTILEAGSVGLPIIASRVGGIQEIIEDKKNGTLVRPKDVLDLKIQIISLLKDKEKRDFYGENIKKTIENNFSKKQMLEKTIKVYSS